MVHRYFNEVQKKIGESNKKDRKSGLWKFCLFDDKDRAVYMMNDVTADASHNEGGNGALAAVAYYNQISIFFFCSAARCFTRRRLQ